MGSPKWREYACMQVFDGRNRASKYTAAPSGKDQKNLHWWSCDKVLIQYSSSCLKKQNWVLLFPTFHWKKLSQIKLRQACSPYTGFLTKIAFQLKVDYPTDLMIKTTWEELIGKLFKARLEIITSSLPTRPFKHAEPSVAKEKGRFLIAIYSC